MRNHTSRRLDKDLIRLPKTVECDACHQPAEIQLRDEVDSRVIAYCGIHKPDLWPGRNRSLTILRWRLPLDNSYSRHLACSFDSAEHQMFRTEMCDLCLLGADGASLYYLSVVTSIDHFALWSDEQLQNLREFADKATNGAANAYRIDLDTVCIVLPLLKSAFRERFPTVEVRFTKQDHAVELLFRNPALSDTQVAEQVPTTIKQLQRFTNYQHLRRSRLST